MKKSFPWLKMSVDCYAVSKKFVNCSRSSVLLRRNQKHLKLFTEKAPLEIVSIDILGSMINAKGGNKILLVITKTFSKLVRMLPMEKKQESPVSK